MKKKRLIISIIIFIVSLFLVTYLYIKYNDLNSNLLGNSSNNKHDVVFPLNIYNFNINLNQNNIHLSVDIENKKNKNIENEKVYLNFYNDKELLYTYEYTIIELVVDDSIRVEANIDFEFDKITRYEFVYDKIKKDMEPYM